MIKPTQKPKLIRYALYFLSSISLINAFREWFYIPLGVLGLVDFNEGKILHLKSGIKFKMKHFMDAWTIKESFVDNEYHYSPFGKKDIVIDIGANIGDFSVFAAYRGAAKVYAFEPSRKTFQQFTNNISLNNMENVIKPFNMAVGGGNRFIKLYTSEMSGLASIYRTRGEKKHERVRSTNLKEIFTSNKILKCDFLKIDCEGAEYEILEKCPSNIYKKIKKIALEFHEMDPNHNHENLISKLKDEGFSIKSQYDEIENTIGYIYATK